jgi:hypothetical protein
VSAAPTRHVLYTLLICGLINASGYAAAIAPTGGQGTQASDRDQKRATALDTATAKPDAASPGEPIKGGDTVTRAAGSHTSATRYGLQSPVVHGAGLIPHRGLAPLPGATGNVPKPAIPTARANPVRRSDPALQRARAFGATGPAALVAARRPVVSLKALAGNGVIGGPHAAGRGTLGGPAIGNSVVKASIDGTALRRRF